MRILSRKKQDESMSYIMEIIAIVETIPIEALGNSADGLDKLSKLYENTVELAYVIDGMRGLNKGVTFFSHRARSFDEMIAISKTHLSVLSRHEKGDK